MNLASILSRTAGPYGDRPTVRLGEATMTYQELDEASARVAGLLGERGLAPGDRIGVMLPNTPEFAVIYYGVLRAGGVVVPMNPLLKAREVAYYLGDSEALLLFVWHGFAEEASAGAERAGAKTVVVDPATFGEVLASARPAQEVAERQPDDTAVILYTSGTTGQPEGRRAHPRQPRHQHRGGADRPVPAHQRGRGLRRAAAVPLVRADVHAQRRGGVGGVPDPAATVRPRPGAADPRRAPRHGGRGRADDVGGVAAQSGPGGVRPVGAAAVHLRRRGDAGRGAAGVRGGVRLPGARGLRPVGDLTGGLLQPPGQGAEAGLDRHANPWRGDAGRRRARPGGPKGGGRRDRDPRPQHHEGLLAPSRGHGQGGPGRVVPHRRPRPGRRGRLLLHRRPDEGPDHPRRLQRVPAGGRGGAVRAPGGNRGRGDRPAHPELGEEVGAAVALKPGAQAAPEELREFVKGQVAAYKHPRRVWIVEALPKTATGKILKREIVPPADLGER